MLFIIIGILTLSCFGLTLILKDLKFKLKIAEEKALFASGLEHQIEDKDRKIFELTINLRTVEEKCRMMESSQDKLKESFKALSSDVLESHSQSFLRLAQTNLEKFQEMAKGDLDKRQSSISDMVNPIKDALSKLDINMKQVEASRKGEQDSLKEQIKMMQEAQKELKSETSNLTRALRSPGSGGRWGEMQLRRIVELSGMLSHCDFYEQKQISIEENIFRPDLIVKLPGERIIVVDAKTPLESYLEAVYVHEAAARETKMKEHSKRVRAHVQALGKKSYWEGFTPTPEFVVLFLPSENCFSSALEYDPALIESSATLGVILATPTTLIALLKAISFGWRQESLSRYAVQVSELGKDLYKRITDMADHFSRLGRSLTQSVESYNKTVGSLENRVLVSARKFKEMGIGQNAELENLEVIEKGIREIQANELKSPKEIIEAPSNEISIN